MRFPDFSRLTVRSITFNGKRSFLTTLAIAIGIAAVVLLTSLGQGIKQYMMAEFTQFGTNLLAINPGKTTTFGVSGAVINTVRPLTLDDATRIAELPGVIAVSPVVQGNAKVEHGHTSRRTTVMGVNGQVGNVWQINIAIGRQLPDDSAASPRSYAVLGYKLRKELFGNKNPLGKKIRIAGESYRVIGSLESKGQILGFDLDDTVYLPAARVLGMFDRDSLMEIDVLYKPGLDSKMIASRIKSFLLQRHGREDFTITTQDEMLKVLNGILDILTLAVAAIGSISLLVGAIGIFTIMTIAVNERIPEIGLLRALGATHAQVRNLFIGESVILALLGGTLGLVIGLGGALLISLASPVPAQISWFYTLSAELLAAVIGILSGVLPSIHAATMNPVDALRSE